MNFKNDYTDPKKDYTKNIFQIPPNPPLLRVGEEGELRFK